MNSQKVYTKNKQVVSVSSKFVYHSETYKLWKNGFCLADDKYYASQKALEIPNKPSIVYKNGYILQRFIELESAPENYLITNGYKCKQISK